MSQKQYIMKQAKSSNYVITIKEVKTRYPFRSHKRATALEFLRDDGKILFIQFDKNDNILQNKLFNSKK